MQTMLTNFVVDWVNYFSRTLLQGKYIKKNQCQFIYQFYELRFTTEPIERVEDSLSF